MAQLKHKGFTRGIHTAYVGMPDSGTDDAGNAKRTVVQPFLFGKGETGNKQIDALLKDVGLIKK